MLGLVIPNVSWMNSGVIARPVAPAPAVTATVELSEVVASIVRASAPVSTAPSPRPAVVPLLTTTIATAPPRPVLAPEPPSADAVDDKTGGKHSRQIDSGVAKAKDALDDLDGKDDDIPNGPAARP